MKSVMPELQENYNDILKSWINLKPWRNFGKYILEKKVQQEACLDSPILFEDLLRVFCEWENKFFFEKYSETTFSDNYFWKNVKNPFLKFHLQDFKKNMHKHHLKLSTIPNRSPVLWTQPKDHIYIRGHKVNAL